jgi:muramidase (phage lysozyme)
MSAVAYSNYIDNKRLAIDPATYVPLLHLIASAESNNNYNAYFGNAGNTSIDFTKMSIAQVMKWQREYSQQGNPSNAVGKYQIISTTLSGLVKRLGIDTTQKFNPNMQDSLAIALIERRGAEEYINKELTRDEFAANLAKEWAALPRVIGDNPNDSYYASDGLNKSRVKVEDALNAIEHISAKKP